MFFPDPVLESQVFLKPQPYLKRTGLICSHCHKDIRGKLHNIGNKFYDDYCYSLRYILEAQELEHEKHSELRKRMEIPRD